jgi:hypothetical protein
MVKFLDLPKKVQQIDEYGILRERIEINVIADDFRNGRRVCDKILIDPKEDETYASRVIQGASGLLYRVSNESGKPIKIEEE